MNINPSDFVSNGKVDFGAFYEALVSNSLDKEVKIQMLESFETSKEIVDYLDNL